MDRLKQDFDYYLAHQDEFVRQYDGKVLVIRDQKVFGAFESLLEAMIAARKQFEPGTFLLQKVSPGNAEYTANFHSRVAFN